jgi:hypothetical protein
MNSVVDIQLSELKHVLTKTEFCFSILGQVSLSVKADETQSYCVPTHSE